MEKLKIRRSLNIKMLNIALFVVVVGNIFIFLDSYETEIAIFLGILSVLMLPQVIYFFKTNHSELVDNKLKIKTLYALKPKVIEVENVVNVVDVNQGILIYLKGNKKIKFNRSYIEKNDFLRKVPKIKEWFYNYKNKEDK